MMRIPRSTSRASAYIAAAAIGAACAGSDADSVSISSADAIEVVIGEIELRRGEVDTSVPAELIETLTSGRGVDLTATGNRVVAGTGALTTAAPITVEMPDGRVAVWIVSTSDGSWLVELDDASVIAIDPINAVATSFLQPTSPVRDPRSGSPLWSDGALLAASSPNAGFKSPLPDGRIVTDGATLVALTAPSDRYAHGVLGDAVEATAVSTIGADGLERDLVQLPEPDVFETITPLLADVDSDGNLDVVVTVSNADVGASVAAYRLDNGELVAATDPIGLGNRWRNLLAVAATGPDGSTELIDIRTPHIGGTLEFFGYDGTQTLEMVASIDGYSTHSIGSRNLDLGIVSDADGDGQLDVILPTQDKASLAVVTRDDSALRGAREIHRIDLGSPISTNVAAQSSGATVGYAVGTADGRVVVWPN